MKAIGVVDVGVVVLFDISIDSHVQALGGAVHTVWFSNETQLGTMMEAKVRPVAGNSSVLSRAHNRLSNQ